MAPPEAAFGRLPLRGRHQRTGGAGLAVSGLVASVTCRVRLGIGS